MSIIVMRHSNYWVRELLDSGRELILIDLDDATLDDKAKRRYSRVYRVPSWDSMNHLARVAGDIIGDALDIEMVYSPIEHTQYAATFLREVFRESSPTFATLATRDKRVMKLVAGRSGLPSAEWAVVHSDSRAEDMSAAIQNLGFPLVAKPVDGFGSMDTEVIHDAEELSEYCSQHLRSDGSHTDMFLCEEYNTGHEYHADALLHGGDVISLIVSRYLNPPRDLRLGAVPDLSIGISKSGNEKLYDAVREGITSFAVGAGLQGGPIHLEFFMEGPKIEWGTDGLVFSEMASRIGGGNIGDYVQVHTGVSMRAQTIAEAVGDDLAALAWSEAPPAPYLGLLNIVPEQSGTIVSVPSVEDLMADPDIYFASVPASAGDTFEVGVSTATWTAVVVLGADTEQELVARAHEITQRFPVIVQ